MFPSSLVIEIFIYACTSQDIGFFFNFLSRALSNAKTIWGLWAGLWAGLWFLLPSLWSTLATRHTSWNFPFSFKMSHFINSVRSGIHMANFNPRGNERLILGKIRQQAEVGKPPAKTVVILTGYYSSVKPPTNLLARGACFPWSTSTSYFSVQYYSKQNNVVPLDASFMVTCTLAAPEMTKCARQCCEVLGFTSLHSICLDERIVFFTIIYNL